jgi:hypothetical protein
VATWEYLQVVGRAGPGHPDYWTVQGGGEELRWGPALQIYGDDGWELVSVMLTGRESAISGDMSFIAVFKRLGTEPEE